MTTSLTAFFDDDVTEPVEPVANDAQSRLLPLIARAWGIDPEDAAYRLGLDWDDHPEWDPEIPDISQTGTIELLPDVMRQVVSTMKWRNNAELIRDAAQLYLDPAWTILDPTVGRRAWWKLWTPTQGKLVTHDKDVDGTDFRNLDYPGDSFDAIAYDPPFVCAGGRKTSTQGDGDFHDRYGMDDAPRTPAELQCLINDGLTEMHRLVKPRGRTKKGDKPKGIVLVKCQDYVSSGKLFPGAHYTLAHALELGFRYVDKFNYVGNVRQQPKVTNGKPRRQVHARRVESVLYVFQKVQ